MFFMQNSLFWETGTEPLGLKEYFVCHLPVVCMCVRGGETVGGALVGPGLLCGPSDVGSPPEAPLLLSARLPRACPGRKEPSPVPRPLVPRRKAVAAGSVLSLARGSLGPREAGPSSTPSAAALGWSSHRGASPALSPPRCHMHLAAFYL